MRTRLSRGPLRINDSAAVLQAVAEGHGIAMARSVMASDGLAAGPALLGGRVPLAAVLLHGVYRAE